MLEDLERSGLGWFWASDAEGRLAYLSPSVAQRLDLPLEELVGQPVAQVFQPAGLGGREKPLSLRLGAHKAFSGVAVRAARREDGAVLRLAGHPVFDDAGRFEGFRGTGADITEEFYREEETERLAKFDSLTGLANRHRMAHLIESTLTAFKAAKRNCAVMMLDLDRFKQVNDTLGHAAGDELLKQVSERLKRAIDRECEIGRLGGDEFQVMIPDLDDRGVLGEIAMKIISMLKQPYSLAEGRCVIGSSVGIAIAPHDGVTREEVVRSADLALYAAKNGGRGQFRFFSGELENEAIFRRRLEADLGTGLSENQLFLKYQPVIEAKSRKVTSLEARICWNHSQRGEIDEEEFASILEGSSLVADVGRWSIREACAHAALWPDSVRVALGVPAPLFNAESFVDDVAEALSETDLPASRLELGISEAVFFGDANQVDRTLGRLFKLGVRLTLDEFGSGYSSLAYLRRAPFDTIRIDSRLVAEADREADGGGKGGAIGGENRELGLVRAIVALAGALGMDTLAGGIESMALNDALVGCGVGFVQGPIYYEAAERETVEAEIMGGGWRIDPSADRTRRARRRTVLRKIHVIHDDHSYEVTLRNLSKTGALIQGLMDVPRGTQFVVDLGGGQLAVATVTRTNGDTQGLEFEQHLVEDGSGGLVTRNRVSPYMLASAGAPLAALSPGSYKAMEGGLGEGKSIPQFGYAPSYRHEHA
ncbi:MAG: EAL domain-containing protein [Erythrobacter sp.]|nr:MAG: EAL domain-containing protein [Erythrobacter sp.]